MRKQDNLLFHDYDILSERAHIVSPIIRAIDSSYTTYFTAFIEANVMQRLPDISGHYICEVTDTLRHVLGYEGCLKIVRLSDGRHTYSLTKPIKSKVKIYAKFDKAGTFFGIAMNPAFGFHFFTSSDGDYVDICLGEMDIAKPNTIEDIKQSCLKIVSMLETCNLTSVGRMYLPNTNPYRKIIHDAMHSETNSNRSWIPDAVEQLLSKQLIVRVI